MAKRKHLDSGDHREFPTLFGLSCHLRDYQLSFYLNQRLDFHFVKQEDFAFGIPGAEEKHLFSFYASAGEDPVDTYCLLSNTGPEGLLIPPLKQTDFLLLTDGALKDSRKETLLKAIRSLPNVLLAAELNPAGIKQIGYLLGELELHRMNIARKSTKPNP